ncbi:hypothetical protein PR003_g13833 [Phytophthora rubi]|uniref:Uncharacterized protein n=1 Tax=Phytophthora rubi TaxID=129364 RepID=A0A6A3M8C1_9STRA|nr:hypothetical protein PR002_g17492 [Phytophthora rubi]KAE9024533.1 hypothetical protein PR001_g12647 [Phytophthora rubi]KAE9333822.1 hypothetical protein PR003_g13833 [Phytophthora rubi]
MVHTSLFGSCCWSSWAIARAGCHDHSALGPASTPPYARFGQQCADDNHVQ